MVTSVQAWLTTALSGLAPEVAARLRAEYLGHAQDMLDAGEPVGAVLGALGDPARLNAELRERYLTEFEAKVLAARSRAWSARAVWVPMVMGVLGALAVSVLNPAVGAWALLLPLLGLVGSGWLWWLARRLPPERLALRGSSALMFLNAVMLAAVQGVNSSRPELVLPLFVGAAALVFAWWEYGLNGRLHAKLGPRVSTRHEMRARTLTTTALHRFLSVSTAFCAFLFSAPRTTRHSASLAFSFFDR